MKKKEVKNKRKIGAPQLAFQICNIILVVAILAFYGYRFFYYKSYFEEKQNPETGDRLSEVIINTYNMAATEGLMKNEDGTYTYQGKTEKNYIYYSGNYYRIIGVDENGNITCISQDTFYTCRNGQHSEYIDSELGQQLMDDYFTKLDNSSRNLNYCINYKELISDVNNIDTKPVEKDIMIRLLSLQEYQQAKGANSFINTNESFWLMNYDGQYNHFFVTEEGNVSTSDNPNFFLPIRVVISIRGGIAYTSGDGTKEKPYIVEKKEFKQASNMFVGQYVSIDSEKYRLYDNNTNGCYLVKVEPLDKKSCLGTEKVNEFNYKKGVGKFLIDEYLNKLNNYTDILNEVEFSQRVFDGVNFDKYTLNSIKGYVCLPSIDNYCLFNGQYLLVDTGSDKSLELSMEDNTLFFPLAKEEKNIYPVICLKGECAIISGSGTLDDPFVIR